MSRKVFIHLEWRGEEIIIPEMADNVHFEQISPPHLRDVLMQKQTTSPSQRTVKVVRMTNLKLVKSWIDRYVEGALSPRKYVEKLDEIRDSLEYARLVIYSSEYETVNDTNMLVLIDFESWEVPHGEEHNIHYNLTMYEHDPREVGIIEPTEDGEYEPPPPPRVDERPPPPATYTVVRGDSLWKITQRFTGDGRRWGELYALNKDVIHSRASPARRGSLIFPGQEFQLPADWST